MLGELRARSRPDAEPVPQRAAPAEVFRYEGELWRLSYAGSDAHLPDLKGLHDLARLLRAPGEEIHCLELAAAPGAGGRAPGR